MYIITPAELLKRYAAGERNFAGITLNNRDRSSVEIFREADLSEAQLQHASLHGVDLAGAKLIGAQLNVADLIRTDLTSADLTGADLSNAYLDKANLTNAILLNANLGSEDNDELAYLDTAIFRNTTMPDGSIRNDSVAS